MDGTRSFKTMSPRERTYVAADPSEERSLGRTAKAIALFAVIAIPLGVIISSIKTREQIRAEQAVFRRSGVAWERRFLYPK